MICIYALYCMDIRCIEQIVGQMLTLLRAHAHKAHTEAHFICPFMYSYACIDTNGNGKSVIFLSVALLSRVWLVQLFFLLVDFSSGA